MTRETKIGLLVGLAFIIVIGILLSDHLTSSTEPPSAPMSNAGSIVRAAVNTPGAAQHAAAQVVPPQVQPNQPVRSAEDFQPRPQPVKIVEVNTPTQNEPVTITSPNTDPLPSQRPNNGASAPDQVAQYNPVQQITEPAKAVPPSRTSDPVMTRLNAEAQKFGQAIIPVGGNPQPQQPAAMSKYKVEPGDTLSKIATKVYGTSSKAVLTAIIEANPNLKDNPNLVIEGRTYNIPQFNTKPGASAPDSSTTIVLNPVKPQLAQAPSKPEPGATYIVEEGDNLTRIAQDQCGAADAVAAIKELNREMLKGGDIIRPGMKLKLPAKSVAVNN